MLDGREFDAPGMATARQKLWKLGGVRSKGKRVIDRRLLPAVRELYPEIKAAREQGHGWGKITDIIKSSTGIPCSSTSVKKLFDQIDAEWERETGVPALEPPPKRRGRPRKRVDDALEKLEARIKEES